MALHLYWIVWTVWTLFQINTAEEISQMKCKNAVLAVTWPISFCITSGKCSQAYKDFLNENNGWKIHGLWQDSKLCKQIFKDLKNSAITNELQGLAENDTQLRKEWPASNNADESFWKYEWTKHGRYTGLTLQQYIRKTQQLYRMFNYTGMLAEGNIAVGTTTSALEIKRQIENKLKVRPMLQISIHNGTGYLQEIRICIQQDYTLINCPGCGNNSALAYFPGLNELVMGRKRREVEDSVPTYGDENVCPFHLTSAGVEAVGKQSVFVMVIECVVLEILIFYLY
ncbi:ribonuclease T2-like isoform X3 [Ostrea edulis]|nr:ribonuclease T2-like isoform X3 [Ostrea edulis]XP_048727286.2 ribonuclease T2-like isoform X3 [Ostrea edulis]